jgi:hypothetical protein
MADEHVVFGPKAVEQIAKTVREVARAMQNPEGHRGRWQGRYPISGRPAVIGSALISPTSSLVAATSCTVYFLELQSDGTQELNETAQTAYNDDPELSASVGTYCRLELLNGRWMIYYLSCNTQAALIAVLP